MIPKAWRKAPTDKTVPDKGTRRTGDRRAGKAAGNSACEAASKTASPAMAEASTAKVAAVCGGQSAGWN